MFKRFTVAFSRVVPSRLAVGDFVFFCGLVFFLLVLLTVAPCALADFGGNLSGDQFRHLDEINKRMHPAPYSPANAPGCQRWKGRALVSRDEGLDSYCHRGCALSLVDADGYSARWEFTGSRCSVRRAQVAAPGRDSVTQPPQQAAAPRRESWEDVRPQAERYVQKPPAFGQASNYDREPIDGPPGGFKAQPKR